MSPASAAHLVIDSVKTDDTLHGWALGAANALPNGSLRRLAGEWHGVAPEVLAPAMVDFFLSDG